MALPAESQLHPYLGVTNVLLVPACIDDAPLHAKLSVCMKADVVQVRWQGRDAEGRPILVVRVAQACQECSSTRAELLGQAILSQVWLACHTWWHQPYCSSAKMSLMERIGDAMRSSNIDIELMSHGMAGLWHTT